MRFIHTSDWQLGMTRHYLAGEAQTRFTADRVDTVRGIGSLAAEVGAGFIVVAGDVFDHHNLSDQDLLRALGAMAEVPVPIYLVPGNHDPLTPGSLWESARFTGSCPDHVHLVTDSTPVPVEEGVEIVAAPWRTKSPDHDPVAPALDGLVADGTVRIVVGHGMLDELDPDRTSLDTVHRAPLEEALAAGTIHYVALGDRHIQWPAPADADPGARIRYSGTHESTDFAEPGRGTVWEVELSADDLAVTSHEVGTWRHLDVAADLSGPEDVDDLADRLEALPLKEKVIVRTALTGTLGLGEAARLDDLLESMRLSFAALFAWQRHTDLAVLPDDDDFSEVAVGGYVSDAVAELAAQARGGGVQAEESSDALRLLYRLAGGARR